MKKRIFLLSLSLLLVGEALLSGLGGLAHSQAKPQCLSLINQLPIKTPPPAQGDQFLRSLAQLSNDYKTLAIVPWASFSKAFYTGVYGTRKENEKVKWSDFTFPACREQKFITRSQANRLHPSLYCTDSVIPDTGFFKTELAAAGKVNDKSVTEFMDKVLVKLTENLALSHDFLTKELACATDHQSSRHLSIDDCESLLKEKKKRLARTLPKLRALMAQLIIPPHDPVDLAYNPEKIAQGLNNELKAYGVGVAGKGKSLTVGPAQKMRQAHSQISSALNEVYNEWSQQNLNSHSNNLTPKARATNTSFVRFAHQRLKKRFSQMGPELQNVSYQQLNHLWKNRRDPAAITKVSQQLLNAKKKSFAPAPLSATEKRQAAADFKNVVRAYDQRWKEHVQQVAQSRREKGLAFNEAEYQKGRPLHRKFLKAHLDLYQKALKKSIDQLRSDEPAIALTGRADLSKDEMAAVVAEQLSALKQARQGLDEWVEDLRSGRKKWKDYLNYLEFAPLINEVLAESPGDCAIAQTLFDFKHSADDRDTTKAILKFTFVLIPMAHLGASKSLSRMLGFKVGTSLPSTAASLYFATSISNYEAAQYEKHADLLLSQARPELAVTSPQKLNQLKNNLYMSLLYWNGTRLGKASVSALKSAHRGLKSPRTLRASFDDLVKRIGKSPRTYLRKVKQERIQQMQLALRQNSDLPPSLQAELGQTLETLIKKGAIHTEDLTERTMTTLINMSRMGMSLRRFNSMIRSAPFHDLNQRASSKLVQQNDDLLRWSLRLAHSPLSQKTLPAWLQAAPSRKAEMLLANLNRALPQRTASQKAIDKKVRRAIRSLAPGAPKKLREQAQQCLTQALLP